MLLFLPSRHTTLSALVFCLTGSHKENYYFRSSNEQTGAMLCPGYGKLMVAPHNLCEHFTELIRRMEALMPFTDLKLKEELAQTLQVYGNDNCSAWGMQLDGKIVQRHPRQGKERPAAQEVFIKVISRQSQDRESNHAQ